ncbi:MAG: hypothetical protein JWL76_2430 [Thermoleophilia bacterium]|nr:hypothetical protein [Thermoleophilia bacterium]
MTDIPPTEMAPEGMTAEGGGAMVEDPTMVAVRTAAAKLELLSPDTRETVLAKMDATIAQRIRDYIASQPDNRPHGQFSTDVATRRQMIHEMADRVHQRRTAEADQLVEHMAHVPVMAGDVAMGGAPGHGGAPADPLDRLRELHPAAIARAMQGERAEAWAIVLDRLDPNARAALQLYLDATARTAIEDARMRQAELQVTAPALLATVVAAIARTVVPRAMREHHQLLSTTPLAWTGMPA